MIIKWLSVVLLASMGVIRIVVGHMAGLVARMGGRLE